MSDQLDKLFSEFNERKEQDHIEEQKKIKQRQGFRALQLPVIYNVVVPVLREFAAELTVRGHESECSGPDENNGSPFAHLSLRILEEGKDKPVEASTLIIEGCENSSEIRLEQSIVNKSSISSQNDHKYETVWRSEVTPEWIRAEIIEFVERVLKAQ